MAGISSIGIGSGVLTSDLVDSLVAAERAPTELRLDRKQAEYEAKLSAYGRIQAALTEFRLPARVLSLESAVGQVDVSSTNSAVSVEGDSSARLGQYSVSVGALATSHALTSSEFASAADVVGEGTLSFTINGVTTDLDIDGTNSSLEGIRDTINGTADLGVNADVVYTGTGYKLVFSATESGIANAMSISVSDNDLDDTDVSGLSQLSFNGVDDNMLQTVAAADAQFTVNGVGVSRSSNSVDDVIEGLTFNLSGLVDVAAPAVLTVEADTDGVVERVQDFVDSYNNFKEIVQELTKYSPDSPDETGLLLGDATLRAIDTQVRRELTDVMSGLSGSNVRSLADIGISSDRYDGTLSLDANKFANVYKSNIEDVKALFSRQGRTSDSQIEYIGSSVNTKPGDYNVDITQLATQSSLTGSAIFAGDITIDADNDNLSFDVDGQNVAITLDAGTYSEAALADLIQTKINEIPILSSKGSSVAVSYDAGAQQFTIQSNLFGSDSQISVTSIDTNTTALLGFSVATGTAGLDVEGTINGLAATGSGKTLRGADDSDVMGLVLQINGGALGDRGTATYMEGVATRLIDTISSFLGVDGSLTSRQQGLQTSLESLSFERSNMEDRLESLQSRLARQFSVADALVAQLNSTGDFITAQLDALAGVKKDK